MSADYTTTEMVKSLKKRGLIPTASGKTYSDADLIRFMSEEMMTIIAPRIMEVRENYFVQSYTQTLVANQARYNIAPRAIGMKFQSCFWVDDSGQAQNKLVQFEIDQLALNSFGDQNQGPVGFYFIDNFFDIVPGPLDSPRGSLRQYYFQRRNRLIATTECGLITGIDTGLNQVTINQTPTSFTTSVVYDFVKGTPGFQNLAIDQVCTGISGTTIEFSELPSDLVLGDYLCLAGESPVVQLPLELFPVVAQTGVFLALEGLHDGDGATRAKAKRDDMLKEAIRLVGTRSENNAKIIASGDNISNYVWGFGAGVGWPR